MNDFIKTSLYFPFQKSNNQNVLPSTIILNQIKEFFCKKSLPKIELQKNVFAVIAPLRALVFRGAAASNETFGTDPFANENARIWKILSGCEYNGHLQPKDGQNSGRLIELENHCQFGE